MSLYKCKVCGMNIEADSTPAVCLKCGAKEFSLLDEEAATKVYRSDASNDLHMSLIQLCMDIDTICEAGIMDNLDPTCVSVFNKAKDYAWSIKEMSKAELASHISKGKY
ncbi:MAG: hypothetical protein RR646_03305 [Erysipelotrichaceae bacterium]